MSGSVGAVAASASASAQLLTWPAARAAAARGPASKSQESAEPLLLGGPPACRPGCADALAALPSSPECRPAAQRECPGVQPTVVLASSPAAVLSCLLVRSGPA